MLIPHIRQFHDVTSTWCGEKLTALVNGVDGDVNNGIYFLFIIRPKRVYVDKQANGDTQAQPKR